MKKASIVTALLLAACAPKTVCDREAQPWTKFGTQEDVCSTAAGKSLTALTDSDSQGPTHTATDTPVEDRPAEDPEDPPAKSDNSDANGKGGNKHDRPDKDRDPQEIAERKKS